MLEQPVFEISHAVDETPLPDYVIDELKVVAEWLLETCKTIRFHEFGRFDRQNIFFVDDFEIWFLWWDIKPETAELPVTFRPTLAYFHPRKEMSGHKSTKLWLI